MTATPSTRNITRAFRLATDADRAAGRDWYAAASDVAVSLLAYAPDSASADDFRDAYVRAAGVLAVLSPRTSWPLNVRYARFAYELHATIKDDHSIAPDDEELAFVTTLPTTGDSARKAWAILEGADVDDTVRGPKVRTFWHQIVDPTSAVATVVDRHALDVAAGRVQSDAERGAYLGKRGAYDHVASLYARAARALNVDGRYGTGWTPATVQATTWIYWRRERAAANHG